MLDLFRRLKTGTPTADQLRGMVDSIDMQALAKSVERTERDRRDALLAADEKALDRAEAGLQVARRDYERAVIARDELVARLVEAEAAEAGQRLDAIQREAEKVRDQVRQALRREGVNAMRELCRVLGMVRDADEAVMRANGQLVAAGRAPIPTTEQDFTPTPAGQLASLYHIGETTRLPVISEWNVPGWPPARLDHWQSIASAGRPAA